MNYFSTEVSLLDLVIVLSIANGAVPSKIYHKHNEFIWKLPISHFFLKKRDVSEFPSNGEYIASHKSERSCTHVCDFNITSLQCYIILSTIAQVSRKMSLKILAY